LETCIKEKAGGDPLHHKGIHLVSLPKQNLIQFRSPSLTKLLSATCFANDMILEEKYLPKEANKSSMGRLSLSSLRTWEQGRDHKADAIEGASCRSRKKVTS
jgi:hypothetical protein